MNEKKVFYLDPDERKWTMEDLGLTLEAIDTMFEESHTIEGVYLMSKGKVIKESELTKHCSACLDLLDYNDEHDSVFCPTCDEWRETPCSDANCEYCLARPPKPSQCK